MIKHGCTLIGIYFFVSGLVRLSSLPTTLSAYDTDLHIFVIPENWPVLLVSVTAAVVFLWLLPSVLLVRFAPEIAKKFGESETPIDISETGLYVVLALALAVYFMIVGLANLAGGLTLLVPELFEDSEYRSLRYGLSPVLMSVIQIISALAIYRHSMKAARPPS